MNEPFRTIANSSHVTEAPLIDRQLMGTVSASWPDSLSIVVYVPSGLKVRLPVSFKEVTEAVSPGQPLPDITGAPVAHEEVISQVPTMLPPQGIGWPQLPPLDFPLHDTVAANVIKKRRGAESARDIGKWSRVLAETTRANEVDAAVTPDEALCGCPVGIPCDGKKTATPIFVLRAKSWP
jgi:hypothetical protein